MTDVWNTWQRTLAVAGLAAAAAWSLPFTTGAVDGALHGAYARALAGADSRGQGVVLIDVGAGDSLHGPPGLDSPHGPPGLDSLHGPPGLMGPALAAAIAGDGPRVVLDAEGWTGCGLRVADGTCLEEHVSRDRFDGAAGLWVRQGGPVFAALAAIGAEPTGPLAVRYVRRLPTLPGARVAAGEIPAGTLTGRVVVVGRAEAGADAVETPLGLMSPAQVEAQALLGALDEAAPAYVPGWLRALVLAAWATLVTLAVRRRGAAGVLGAAVAGVMLDAGLFMSGTAAIGAGALVVTVATVGVVLAALGGLARAEARGEEAPAASGLHKVSGA